MGECRTIPGYTEESAPNPLVVFFSDGANTGGDVTLDAQALRAISFSSGNIDVVAVGIGMNPEDFPVMQRIASKPDLAVNIDRTELSAFIADVGATAVRGETPAQLIKKYD